MLPLQQPVQSVCSAKEKQKCGTMLTLTHLWHPQIVLAKKTGSISTWEIQTEMWLWNQKMWEMTITSCFYIVQVLQRQWAWQWITPLKFPPKIIQRGNKASVREMPSCRIFKQRKSSWKTKGLFEMHLKVTNGKQKRDKIQSPWQTVPLRSCDTNTARIANITVNKSRFNFK